MPAREVIRLRDCEEVELVGCSWSSFRHATVVVRGKARAIHQENRASLRPFWLLPVCHVLGPTRASSAVPWLLRRAFVAVVAVPHPLSMRGRAYVARSNPPAPLTRRIK